MARVSWYFEDLTRTTTTTTNFSAVKVTSASSFTPTSGKAYALFWSCILDAGTGSSSPVLVRLQNITDSTTLGQNTYDVQLATTEKNTAGGVAFFTSTDGSVKTFQIQFASNNVSVTVGISEASLLILELGTNDKTNETVAAGTVTTTITKATVALGAGSGTTPLDYLVIASTEKKSSDGSTDGFVRLTGNGISNSWRPGYINTGEPLPAMVVQRALSISATVTFALDMWRSSGTGFLTFQNSRILALRMADFPNHYWGEDRTAHSSSVVTYVNSVSIAAVTTATDHLIIASGINSGDGSSPLCAGGKVNIAGADMGSIFQAASCFADQTYYRQWWQTRRRTPAAGTTTWNTQYAKVNGTGNIVSDEHVFAALDLGTGVAGPQTVTASGMSGMNTWGGVPVLCPSGV